MNGTVNNYIKMLRSFSKYLEDREIGSLVIKIKLLDDDSEDADPLTDNEIQKLLAAPLPNPRIRKEMVQYTYNLYRDILLCIYITGLRFSDIQNADISEVLDNRLKRRQEKTGKYVTVFLHEPLYSQIQKRIEGRSGLIFKTFRDTPVPRQKFNDWLRDLGEKIGIRSFETRCHAHNVRHAFATEMLKHKADLRSIQLLMGHQRLETTAKYLELDTSYLENQSQRHPMAAAQLDIKEQSKIIDEYIVSLGLAVEEYIVYKNSLLNKDKF